MKSYIDFIKKCWENKRLLSLMLELTYSCQFKCPFCYNVRKNKGDYLNLKDYEKILKEGKEEGGIFLTLTGGEPTLNKIFFKICKIANDLSWSIRIKSNGYEWNEDFVKRLKEEVDPFSIDLSIHSIRKETFERVTGIRGSFESFIKTIENLKKYKIRMRLKFPVTKINENEIEEVFNFAIKERIPIDSFCEITPTDDLKLYPLDYMASKEAIRKMYEIIYLNEKKENFDFISEEEADKLSIEDFYICGAGVSFLTVDPFGNAYPCVAWRYKIGNLKEKSLKELWNSKKIEKIRKINLKASKRKALQPLIKNDLFCPGNAYSQFKNPLTIYPEAVIISKIKKEVLNFLKKEKENEK